VKSLCVAAALSAGWHALSLGFFEMRFMPLTLIGGNGSPRQALT
jgi:hypothetical protein